MSAGSSPPTRVLAQAPGTIAARVGGALVVHDPTADRYVRLNPAATALWERLERPASVADLAAELISRYGVDTARADEDAEALVAALHERGLVSVTGSADA